VWISLHVFYVFFDLDAASPFTEIRTRATHLVERIAASGPQSACGLLPTPTKQTQSGEVGGEEGLVSNLQRIVFASDGASNCDKLSQAVLMTRRKTRANLSDTRWTGIRGRA